MNFASYVSRGSGCLTLQQRRGVTTSKYKGESIFTRGRGVPSVELQRILELIEDVSFDAMDYLVNRGYRFLFNTINTDLLDEIGDVICRGSSLDLKNFISIHRWTNSQKLEWIDSVILALQLESRHVYNPAVTRSVLGVDIPASANGLSPDFRDVPEFLYAQNRANAEIQVKLSGVRNTDERVANELAGLARTPEDYVWHHLDDFNPVTGLGTLQLVRKDVHSKIFVTSLKGQIQPLMEILIAGDHAGGVAMWSRFYSVGYQ